MGGRERRGGQDSGAVSTTERALMLLESARGGSSERNTQYTAQRRAGLEGERGGTGEPKGYEREPRLLSLVV